MKLRRVEPGSSPWPDVSTLPDVSDIVLGVQAEGDAAVARIAKSVGDPPPRSVSQSELVVAYRTTDAALRQVITNASDRIELFAKTQRASLCDVALPVGGMTIGHRALPIERVGIYVPGGRHPLVSTVLMCATPARVAGVSHITMCTPNATRDTLAAAHYAGVDACFEIGGAQAIAAMAFGTESVPKVDLIVGPGNAYVTAAKRLVFGVCGIDMLAGPSEVLVIASNDADPALVSADLLAQAEHDIAARVMFLTDDSGFAAAVDVELTKQQLVIARTSGVVADSIERYGCCAILPLPAAALWANELAPEHLELQGTRAEALASELRSYGALFIGRGSAEVFGDYGIGPNHVLPTSSNARFASGLSVFTFLILRTYLHTIGDVDPEVIKEATIFAGAEGLEYHSRAARARL